MDVALVTYRELPDLFPDDQPLHRALLAAGIDAGIVAWDDPDFDWSTAQIALLRSPWDYYRRPDEFLAWAERTNAATSLVNPLELVRWNLHKGYLVELAAKGLPVVPTALVPRTDTVAPGFYAQLLAQRGWSDAVVKPAISADSWETIFVPAAESERGEAHLARLAPERDMLVQPFLRSVETYGERCLVFLDGSFSHAVRKNALTQGGRWTDLPEGAPVAAAEDELAIAGRILDAAGIGSDSAGALYARVDLTRDDVGRPLLLELELTEPTLFLADAPAGLARLVGALGQRLNGSGRRTDSALR
ncbi:MAG: hypothetical protein ABI639_05505 [Thermoanaerobaculia bacterium]